MTSTPSPTAASQQAARPYGPRRSASIVARIALMATISGCGTVAVASAPRLPPAGSANALAHARWSVRARSPLGRRSAPTVAWDGRELLELGGSVGQRFDAGQRTSGAAYNPSTGRWRRVAQAPAAVLPYSAASVWTGRQEFIFGERSSPAATGINVGELYNPAPNRWMVTSDPPVEPLEAPVAVRAGQRVILAGISSANRALQVAAYSPRTNSWVMLRPPISPHHPPLAVAMVATNDAVLLWSLWGRYEQTGPGSYVGHSGIDVFRLSRSGTWANVTGSWAQGHTVDEPTYTGSEILLAPGQIWCGQCKHPAPIGEHGYIVNPTTLRRTSIPHGPLDDLGPQIIWTGHAEISFNPSGEITGPHIRVLPGDIAFWNPRTRRWARGPRAPRQIGDAPAVWSGTRLYVLARDGSLLAYGN